MRDDPLQGLYRKLPAVGAVVASAAIEPLLQLHSRERVTEAIRVVLAQLRQRVKAGTHDERSLELCLGTMADAVAHELQSRLQPSLRRVINATGVILQTNLGRAPLSEAAIARIVETARGYCNLEFDLDTGERSRRDVHAEKLILQVLAMQTGRGLALLPETHGAAVVNNCAAATFLALNTLAEGGEVIVSRGELVEIGGGFRIPDILRKSGAVLREVGTTNRTRIADYAAAITSQTRLILRVHQSNFRIEGFTERPSLQELKELSERAAIPVFDDQGTGCLVSLDAFGMPHESSWTESVAGGAALVAASGDKLLGGPQCGLLVGTRDVIERVRANPLFRALRVDKLTYAALEATLLAYLSGEESTLPVVAMLSLSAASVQARCHMWAEALRSEQISAEVLPTRSLVGGGTTAGASLPSYAVALQHAQMTETALAATLRGLDPPVVARTSQGSVLLDLRTVPAADDLALIALLKATFGADAHLAAPSDDTGRLR